MFERLPIAEARALRDLSLDEMIAIAGPAVTADHFRQHYVRVPLRLFDPARAVVAHVDVFVARTMELPPGEDRTDPVEYAQEGWTKAMSALRDAVAAEITAARPQGRLQTNPPEA